MFDHPTILAESATVFGPTLRDHGPDAALTQRTTVARGIVASISPGTLVSRMFPARTGSYDVASSRMQAT